MFPKFYYDVRTKIEVKNMSNHLIRKDNINDKNDNIKNLLSKIVQHTLSFEKDLTPFLVEVIEKQNKLELENIELKKDVKDLAENIMVQQSLFDKKDKEKDKAINDLQRKRLILQRDDEEGYLTQTSFAKQFKMPMTAYEFGILLCYVGIAYKQEYETRNGSIRTYITPYLTSMKGKIPIAKKDDTVRNGNEITVYKYHRDKTLEIIETQLKNKDKWLDLNRCITEKEVRNFIMGLK